MKQFTEIKLIAGLGNPGAQYEKTRHNAGFMIIEEFLKNSKVSFDEKHICSSNVFSGKVRGRKVFLQQPLTFMNLSGKAIANLMRKHNINANELLLIYDDTDLPLGTVRIREKGSSGGHNGVGSVIECLQSSSFPRMRVGVSSKERKDQIDFVLSEFTGQEQRIFDKVKIELVEAVKLILVRGIKTAMNQYNGIDYSIENEE